jgi:leucyl-tRNA synthetase
VQGVARFLDRVWRLFVGEDDQVRIGASTSEDARRALHVAIKEATEGIEAMRFNTPIAKMMELVNVARGEPLPRAEAEAFLIILHPYAPHITEELWHRLGNTTSVYGQPWPAWDEAALAVASVAIAVQVGGKLRGTFPASPTATNEELLAGARAVPNVAKYLDESIVLREVVVPGKLVNFVVKPKA